MNFKRDYEDVNPEQLLLEDSYQHRICVKGFLNEEEKWKEINKLQTEIPQDTSRLSYNTSRCFIHFFCCQKQKTFNVSVSCYLRPKAVN